MNLITFILTAYGMTFIIVYGKIFEDIRPKKDYTKKWNTLFHCPLCVGFHVGWFLFLISPYTQLFNFDYTLATAFCLSCISAGTSYFISMIVSDSGFNLNIEQPGDIE